MSRVSTASNYQSALLNLNAAQTRQLNAQARISTQKVATDLAGFGRGAESLTTLKSAQARVQGFITTNEAVAARLTRQDLALNQISDAATGAAGAIGNALSVGNVTLVIQELESYFQSARAGLNTQHNGDYVFAGGSTDKAPVRVASLSELAAAPDVASAFGNDRLVPTSRIDEGTTVRTGYLADDIATDVFSILRDIQAYHEDPATGPLTGQVSDAQRDFLTQQVARLKTAASGVVNVTASNGALQKQVDQTLQSHADHDQSLEILLGSKTDADLAQAISDLQLSQVAVQASAQVISQLSEVSLLNFLR